MGSMVTLKLAASPAGSAIATIQTRPPLLPARPERRTIRSTGGGFFCQPSHARYSLRRLQGFHFLTGTGVGRYGTTSQPDVTVHPNGTLAPIKGDQALLSIELHPAPKLDLFGYYGAEYAQRTTYLNSKGVLVGYAPVTGNNIGCGIETLPTSAGNGFAGATPYNPGVPANCLGATRAVTELSIGFTYRVYASPKYGRLQYQGVYSYLSRNAWAGVGGDPKAVNNMVFGSMRYYIP